MADAKARFRLEGENATAAAFAEALRDAKVVTNKIGNQFATSFKAVNLAAKIFIGQQLAQVFRGILQASSESAGGANEFGRALEGVRNAARDLLAAQDGLPAATQAMHELRDVLRDPALRASADAFTSTLIRGFASAAKLIGETAAGLRQLGVQGGLFQARNQQERIDANEAEIRRLEQERDRLFFGEFPIGNTKAGREQDQRLLAQIEALRRENELLQNFSLPDVDLSAPKIDIPDFERLDLEAEVEKIRAARSELKNFGGIVSIDPEQLEATRGDIAETFDFIEQDADRTLASVTESINQSVAHWNAGIDLFRDGMKAAFDDLVDHGHFSFRKLGQFMLAELTRKKLYDAIDAIGDAIARAFSRTGGGGKSGAGGFIGTVLSAVFGGGRANGGPLEPGKWYIAGEKGPEPIWGGGPGAFAAPGMARPTTVVINNYMDNRGATTDFIQALPALIRANNEQLKQDIFDQLERRGR